MHSNPTGTRDLPYSPFTRNYFMSSMQHGTGSATNRGACQQFQNPLSSSATQRALFIALDDWATNNRKPPDSRVPTFKDGTLVPPLPQSGMGFPNIPSPFADTPGPFVTYTGLKTTRYHFDYGLNFYETGIATINPPTFPFTTPSYQDDTRNGPIYPDRKSTRLNSSHITISYAVFCLKKKKKKKMSTHPHKVGTQPDRRQTVQPCDGIPKTLQARLPDRTAYRRQMTSITSPTRIGRHK